MVRSPKTVVDDFIYGVANRGKHKGGAVMGTGLEKSDNADRERDVEGRDRGHDNDNKEKEKDKDLKHPRKEVRSNSLVDPFKPGSEERNGKDHQAAAADNSHLRNCMTSLDSVTTDSFTSNNSYSNSGNHANVATPTACSLNSNSNSTASSRDLHSNATPVPNPVGSSSPLVPSSVTEELPNDFMSEEVQALWIEFMDGVALLQAADASSIRPDSDEALCMFLNLYHLMVIHSSLVMGPPCSAYKVCPHIAQHILCILLPLSFAPSFFFSLSLPISCLFLPLNSHQTQYVFYSSHNYCSPFSDIPLRYSALHFTPSHSGSDSSVVCPTKCSVTSSALQSSSTAYSETVQHPIFALSSTSHTLIRLFDMTLP